MCARYNLHSDPKLLVDQFGVEVGLPMPRFNIAPTQFVPLIRPAPDRPGREVAQLRWGLIPSWANDIKIGVRHINARAETVAEKPAFRAAFKRRRCLVPASGFYEWTGPPKKRLPHLFSMRDARPFAFAGLWEKWDRDGEPIESFTILTTEANELCGKYHDRMPVIVHRNDYDLWMNGEPADVGVLLRPYPCDEMAARPLSDRVNNSRNEGPDLLDEPVARGEGHGPAASG